jgi:hypothetical protein
MCHSQAFLICMADGKEQENWLVVKPGRLGYMNVTRGGLERLEVA